MITPLDMPDDLKFYDNGDEIWFHSETWIDPRAIIESVNRIDG